jgi:hypothetical protein
MACWKIFLFLRQGLFSKDMLNTSELSKGRNFMVRFRQCLAIGLILAASVSPARGEEGLWTLEQAARPGVAQRIGLKDGDGVRRRLASSVVRFSSGQTGTLVSTRGLVITVRSVAMPCLNAASRRGADHVRDGFGAGHGEELKCPDFSVDQLVSSKDVTAQLRKGIADTEPIPADRIALLEKECRRESGLACRVNGIFGGAVMRLEQFRRYEDVRLAFAPEYRVTAFGPSSAHMIFPRHSLDVALFRIYENDKPLSSVSSIPWQVAGPADEDSVILASYPDDTQRHLPWVFLEPLVSLVYRFESEMAREQAQLLLKLSRKHTETAIQENERARLDRLAAELRNAMAMFQNRPIKRKQQQSESTWRDLADTSDVKTAATAWAAAETAQSRLKEIYRPYLVVEGERVLPFGQLFDIGRQLVRWTEEKKKAESDRLPEFRGAGMEDIVNRLSRSIPLSVDVEEALIAQGLLRLRSRLGAKNPLVQTLAGALPEDQAARIVVGTRLADESVRKQIIAAGELGEFSEDPLVVFVKAVETYARPLREKYEREVQRNLSVYLRTVGGALSAADHAGNAFYPDASGDLRLSSGQVRGFLGFRRGLPAQIVIGGFLTRSSRARPGSPWELPARWLERRRQIDLTKPINFVIDADVGSGAPGGVVLNQSGELIGMVIGTTLKSSVNHFLYRGGDERAVAVHPAGMIEALRNVYGDGRLADELMGEVGK